MNPAPIILTASIILGTSTTIVATALWAIRRHQPDGWWECATCLTTAHIKAPNKTAFWGAVSATLHQHALEDHPEGNMVYVIHARKKYQRQENTDGP